MFNDFQNGVIVNVTSGANMGTFGFGKLQLFINRVTGAPEDCLFVVGCSDPSLYIFIAATSSDGLNLSVRRPGSGTYGGAQDIRETFDLSPAVHSRFSVDITLDAWDSESIGGDEHLAHVEVTYNIDNLWGLFDSGDHFQNTDENPGTWPHEDGVWQTAEKIAGRGAPPIPTAHPLSLVVFTSRPYGTRGAATVPVPGEAAAAPGLGAVGVAAEGAVTGAVVGTVPFTLFFRFLDDVVFGGRPDRLAGYRMRILRQLLTPRTSCCLS